MAGLIKRGKTYYALYYVGETQKRVSLRTKSCQIAKEKLRQIESSLARSEDSPLPTRNSISEVATRYVEHIRTVKRPKSAQTDIYYLRSAFGAICPALEITSRKFSTKLLGRGNDLGNDNLRNGKVIEAPCFEQITTADIAEFISYQVRTRGLAAKTANHFRGILCRMFNWSVRQGGIKLPGSNPAAAVERYREKASQIRFLTLAQIEEQLDALAGNPKLQAMVAMYIYAGLRKEEALWRQMEDVNLKAGHNGMIRVRAKQADGEYWQPKTGRNRAVPISRILKNYLLAYKPKPMAGGWYFSSPKGLRYDPDNFSRELRRANRKAGLSWSCLDYRHTFGSQLAMKGESLYKISTLMGNSPEICRRHYAALIPEELSDSVEFDQRTTGLEYIKTG